MNSIKLSKRLQVVADHVREGARLADIGSDHAYLPISLVEQYKIDYAVAGEVVEGPFQNALKEVQKRQLQDKIEVRFGDGLSVLTKEDAIDTVTICGMGGALIRRILEEGKEYDNLTHEETLILQPNVHEVTIREFLMENNYVINDETIIEENGKNYEIIKAVPSKKPVIYTEKERLFGPILLEEQSLTFQKKWKSILEKDQFILSQMKTAKASDEKKMYELEERITMIKEVLSL